MVVEKLLELKSVSNDTVETLGILKTPIEFHHWQIPRANNNVVADEFEPILGQDLFDQLGIKIMQKPCLVIHLQPKLKNELKKLQTESHIKKLSICSD